MAAGTATATVETPLYISLNLQQKPAVTGCSIAMTRDAMLSALKKAGYTGSPPKIGWDTNHAAVVLFSADGTQTPYTYVPGTGTLQVIVQRAPASPQNWLFVMEIDKSAAAAATSCLLKDANAAPVATSTTTIVRGASAGTKTSPQ